MIAVERKRSLAVPAERLRALLANVDHFDQLQPRVEQVEVLQRGENRARIAVFVRIGRLGTQRVEGEARLLDDGMRFVAVQPFQMDLRWIVVSRDGGADVIVRIAGELPRTFAAMLRFVPQRVIEKRVGDELELTLDRLSMLAEQSEGAENSGRSA